ncbi:50S ribosomal protein L25/general stress protein Ctc [Corynebacterium propinquum]|uniref:Large ribosomal subunit protein bL25 n=1 Tax=Corynebacterium propinquum TaxID=43769 RepID=A0AAP4BSE4_9CORY|nr:50S ribosomal protein L25/general stress protein Ctc [Corynebacterium propinquum]MCG7232383.1 50S ribosomal protein L25/general stress protein Ctc [Corynebacterium propinquum]MCT1817358.1 50S ribosomal protein L25/general stress protein Ctc [Corynebacterium propinquum]MDK4238926.1 50S ribosomal protein L25/general stress protein Ctc [Corynebacterium propinquum]MDK4251228.1 50S ribosomal protein L25/general stress protein Ctc [Corynebacterium propinquum]MDK4291597.1 50S ribosomal protein L25
MAEKTPTLAAQPRTEFGKGAARRLRREWRVPGVLYGSNTEPIHFSVDLLELQTMIRYNGLNAVLELEVDGEKHLSMVKNVDQNVLTLDVDHVDLLSIKRGEKVEVEVPVTITGEPAAGLMFIQDNDVLLVEADVLSIPEEIEVSIEGAEDGTVITAAELDMPGNTTLVAEEDTVIVSVMEPQEDEELEAAAAAAEEGGADAGADSEEEADEETPADRLDPDTESSDDN